MKLEEFPGINGNGGNIRNKKKKLMSLKQTVRRKYPRHI
jgi:hypothetical protein